MRIFNQYGFDQDEYDFAGYDKDGFDKNGNKVYIDNRFVNEVFTSSEEEFENLIENSILNLDISLTLQTKKILK